MKRRLRRSLRLAAVLLALAGGVVAAGTATAAGEITVREVDTFGFPEVRLEVLVDGGRVDPNDFVLRENGTIVPDLQVRPLGETTKAVGTVLVIDVSGSMRTGGAMDAAKRAARQFVEGMGPHESVAIVSFASEASLRSGFTQDRAALLAAIDSLTPRGETALWDGLVTGARLLADHPELQSNLVFLSDGTDTVSSAGESQAVAAVSDVHAAVYGVAIASEEFDPRSLAGFVDGTDGVLSSSSDPGELGERFGAIRAALENQYELVYQSTGSGGSLSLDLKAGDASTRLETRAGTVGVAEAPAVVRNGGGGLFDGGLGIGLVILLAFGTAGLFIYALMSIFGRGQSGLARRLEQYGSSRLKASEGEASPVSELSGSASAIVKRAVELTSRFADRAGLLVKVEAFLDQTNLPLRPAEALFFYGAGVGVALLFGFFVAPSVPIAVFVVAGAIAIPLVAVKRMRRMRLAAFERMLPDTLTLLAGSLRAGYSFLQGVEAVAQETDEPMAGELRRALAEARLGRPMEDALGDIATRMGSQDFEWAVMAIRIQREVGGNLAELLSTVAETMNQRTRLKREVKALTAEGRMSAIVVAMLPVAIGGYMAMAAPDYIGTLFSSNVGWIMVGASFALAVAGFVWLQKIVNIEV